jgi:hypothetical protein
MAKASPEIQEKAEDPRYPSMDITQLKGIVEQEIANGEYTSIDDIKKSMDYYLAQPRGDEVEGRSTIQSRDVADMTEALTAEIMPILQDPNLVLFEAVSPQDEQQALLESRMVNHYVQTKNNGYILIQQMVKDALMFRNCVSKAFKEVKQRIYSEEYDQPLTEVDLAKIQMALPANVQLIHDPDTPNVCKKLVTTERMQIDSVPIEEFINTPNWNMVTLEECPFTCHHRELRRYELLEYGYDHETVFELNASKAHLNQNENLREDEDHSQASSKSLDFIDYYECYLRVDFDRDGFAELRKVVLASDTIIDNEEVSYHPFAGGTAIIMPHRFKGQSVYDRLFDVQDAKTGIMRQWMDNMNNMNNRRLEAEIKQILDPSELTESRPGGIIKVKKIGSVVPIPVDDIGPSCNMALNYWDEVRTNRSGAALDMHSENMPIQESTAHGVERLVSSKEMVSALDAKTLAETALRSLYILVHKVMKHEFGGQELNAKVGDTWITTDPDVWLDREEATIKIGMSQGENTRKLQALDSVIMQQMQTAEAGGGGILLDDVHAYTARVEYARAAGLPFPEKYWQDPRSPQGQQAKQAQQKQQQKMEAQQEEMRQLQMQLEKADRMIEKAKSDGQNQVGVLKEKVNAAQLAMKAAEADENLRFDYVKHFDDIAVQIAALEVQYEQDIELEGMNGQKTDGD